MRQRMVHGVPHLDDSSDSDYEVYTDEWPDAELLPVLKLLADKCERCPSVH